MLKAGQRRFDIEIQGQKVFKGFDVSGDAGGPLRTVIKEFKNVRAEAVLTIRLLAPADAEVNVPILSGVEIIADMKK